MSRRPLRSVAPALALVIALGSPVGDPAPTTTAPDTATSIVENEFVPANANIGDCVSALPRPGCGSEARGGWRQALVLAAVVAGLALIGWRVVVGVRRNRPARATEDKLTP
jgi:hypothetical protein